MPVDKPREASFDQSIGATSLAANLCGVIAAIATPIEADGRPDVGRFVSLANALFERDCDGLNVLGTTGEGTSFSHADRIFLMKAIAKSELPLDRILVGVGAAAMRDAAELTAIAAELGFRGALALPPFYYKGVPADGIVRFFSYIVDATKDRQIPIYLYNFPALSGVPFDPALVRRLLSECGDRIAGLKDSSGDLAYASQVASLSPQFAVFPSNESTLLEARAGRFAGCISATANINSDLCARAYHDGDSEALARATAIRALFDGRPLVAGVKALLAHLFGDEALASVLPPLQPGSHEDRVRLVEAYEALGVENDRALRRRALG
jgi:4-hydroxy-tetrahydrodipicolinate synthase